MVGFSENVTNAVSIGDTIPLDFELLEDGLPARNISEVILIHPFIDTDDDGEADVFDEDDDGATNLEECLAGTNPNVDEDALLKDSFEDIEPPK